VADSTPVTTAAPAPRPSFARLAVRRTAIGVVLMVLVLAPVIALMAITKQPAASYAAMGALIGAVAVAAGGLRLGVLTAVVVALLAPLSIVAGLTPVTGAALMALMTLFVGRMSRFGLHRAVMLVPIFLAWTILSPIPWIPRHDLDAVRDLMHQKGMTLTDALARIHPPTGGSGTTSSGLLDDLTIKARLDHTYLVWISVFFFVGAITAVLVLALALRKANLPKPAAHPRSESMPYTVTITVLATVATYWFLDHPRRSGARSSSPPCSCWPRWAPTSSGSSPCNGCWEPSAASCSSWASWPPSAATPSPRSSGCRSR
jgi:hypothetical protein